MAEYRLHCFAQSGNAYKAALMLALAGADWEPVFVDFFNGGTRTEAFRSLNPMGEAPVLEHGDLRLTQSGVMLDYLTETLGILGPETPDERREILRWTLWDNHKLTANIATLRFMTNFLAPGKRDAAVIRFLDDRAKSALAVLEAHLARRDWIVADRMTTADVSCAGYLFYAEEFGMEMADYPAIARWRDRIAARPGWKHPYDLMPGHPLPTRA